MRMRRAITGGVMVLALVLTIGSTAQTQANTVADTKAVDDTRTTGANDLKPTQCASVTLTAVVSGSGTVNGTAANELITGATGADSINGGGGNDCVLGGDGDDDINGGGGTDICIGGGGTDAFHNCETEIQ